MESPILVTASRGGVEAVDRALTILASFQRGRERQSLAQLAANTGYYKSTILRLSHSLEHAGYLHRGADGCFGLGTEPLRLAEVYRRGSPGLESHVRPVLRDVCRDSGETASFFRRHGNRRLCMFREETRHAIRDHVMEGDLLPLDVGAAGHVLTKFATTQPGSDLARDLPISSFGERDPETAAIAAPVFARDGLCGALAISGPGSRLSPDRMKELAPMLIAHARHLSRLLGGHAWESEAC